jgi:hypothetical protein
MEYQRSSTKKVSIRGTEYRSMIEHRPVREKKVSIVFIEPEEQFDFPSTK